MLVLGRRENEIIEIGGNIFVKIIEIKGDSVRIGIDAPKDVAVHRKEVADVIRDRMHAITTEVQTTLKVS